MIGRYLKYAKNGGLKVNTDKSKVIALGVEEISVSENSEDGRQAGGCFGI